MLADGAIGTSILEQLSFFDLLGVLGALLYMANYARLVMQSTTAGHAGYFVINLMAASLVLTSLMETFNLGATMIQLFFVVMSLFGIFGRLHLFRHLRRWQLARRPGSPYPQPIRWFNQGSSRGRG